MADISSIQLNNTTYNIKDTNAVRKSGDTINGSLALKTTWDINEPQSSNVFYDVLKFYDKNNIQTGYLNNSLYSNGAVCTGIGAHNGNTSQGNNLILGIRTDGTKYVYVADPTEWRRAIGAVNKAGDTITGELKVNQNQYIYHSSLPTLIFTESADATTYPALIRFRHNDNLFYIEVRKDGATVGEAYKLPVPTSTTAVSYDILTTKNIPNVRNNLGLFNSSQNTISPTNVEVPTGTRTLLTSFTLSPYSAYLLTGSVAFPKNTNGSRRIHISNTSSTLADAGYYYMFFNSPTSDDVTTVNFSCFLSNDTSSNVTKYLVAVQTSGVKLNATIRYMLTKLGWT